MKSNKIQAVTALAFCLFAVTLVFGAADAAPKCPKAVKVVVKKVIGQDFQEEKVFEAKVKPGTYAVKTTVNGQITDLKVTKGDRISQGLEMAVIDNARTDEITKLEKEVKTWKRTLKARQGWKVRSERAEKQAERKLEESTKKLEEVKASLGNYRITAPANGMIKSLNVNKGDKIAAGAVLAEIEDTRVMFTSVKVSDEERDMFSKGQEVVVLIDELGKKAKAVVMDISGNEVNLGMKNNDNEVKAGHTLKFKLLKETHKNVVVLPKCALGKDDSGIFAYKAVGKRAYKTNLEIGAIKGKECWVKSGIGIGEEYVTAEVLSPEEGTIKDSFECMKDNVKIKPMVKDAESNTFVKGKVVTKRVVKKEVVKKEEPVKTAPEKPKKMEIKKAEPATETARNKIALGLGGGIFHVNQTSWGDVFKKANPMFGARLGVFVMKNVEIFGEYDYMKASGELIPTGDKIDARTTVISFGGRYLFRNGFISPYVGLAGAITGYKGVNPYGEVHETAFGPSIQVGTYLNITKNLAIDIVLKYDRALLKNEEFDVEGDMSGARLLFFLTLKI